MMTDIWDEKPTQYQSGSLSYYNATGMNAWLKKVKDKLEWYEKQNKQMWMNLCIANEKAEKYDAQKQSAIQIALALNIPIAELEKLGHSSEEVAKTLSWKEKAEQYDRLFNNAETVYTDYNTKKFIIEVQEYKRGVKPHRKKLEAIKNHLQGHPAKTPIKIFSWGDTEIEVEHSEYVEWFKKLIEILEDSK